MSGCVSVEGGRVQLARCWSCITGYCFDPPEWHTWADSDDREYAAANGRPDPSTQRCGCDCAVGPGVVDNREQEATDFIAIVRGDSDE